MCSSQHGETSSLDFCQVNLSNPTQPDSHLDLVYISSSSAFLHVSFKNKFYDSFFTGVGSHSLLQGIFPSQGSKPALPHCRQILYHLSYMEDPKVAQSCPTLCNTMGYRVHGTLQARILEWVAIPFSRGSSQPRDQTWVSCDASRFFTI